MKSTILRLFLALLSISLTCSCIATPSSSSNPLPVGSTYLLHLPGIAGDTFFDRWWMDALQNAGAVDGVQLFDWTCHDPWIDALQAYDRNHEEATKIAEVIAARRRQDPHGKIIITAESGGTGLAVWALENLPKAVQVDEVILVAPAISPDYNLSRALAHVRGRMVYFDSPGDWFMLGWGTRTFGTIDGKKSNSAGFVGFHPPPTANAAAYRKLVELKYDQSWWWWGNFGGHTGAMSVTFAQNYIAPLLKRLTGKEVAAAAETQPATHAQPLSPGQVPIEYEPSLADQGNAAIIPVHGGAAPRQKEHFDGGVPRKRFRELG